MKLLVGVSEMHFVIFNIKCQFMIPILSLFEILSYFYKNHYGWDTIITDGTQSLRMGHNHYGWDTTITDGTQPLQMGHLYLAYFFKQKLSLKVSFYLGSKQLT